MIHLKKEMFSLSRESVLVKSPLSGEIYIRSSVLEDGIFVLYGGNQSFNSISVA